MQLKIEEFELGPGILGNLRCPTRKNMLFSHYFFCNFKGAAAFWYNLLPSGSVDGRTRHGGCPVLLGSKWGILRFIFLLFSQFIQSIIHILIIQLINYLDNYSHLFIYIDKFSFIFIHSFIYSFKYNCLQLVTSGYTRVDKSLSVHVEKRSTRRMFIQINTCHNTMHRKYRH